MRRAACCLAWVASIGIASAAAADSELDAAKKDAERGTTSLEQRPCPALGDRNYVRGLTDSQQLVGAAERERAYVDGALQQLQQIARDPQLATKQRTSLQTLASWSIAASMANWSTLQVAQQALANPLVEQGKPHPASALEGAQERLRKIGENGALAPDAAGVVRRQVGALEKCSKSFNAAIFQLNQPQFDAAIESASSAYELNRIEQLYRARDAASGGYGADSLDRLTARRSTIAEAERVARENAAVLSAADAAKRQEEADKRQAELMARLPGYLEVAKRFASASQNGNEKAALAELSRDVVMSTPQGSYRGIDQVAAAVRQQSASGRGGSLGTPRISGTQILSEGNSGGYRITTVFGFDGENRISRIDIRI